MSAKELNHLSLMPGTHVVKEERINSVSKLSSDPHMCTMACAHICTHKYSLFPIWFDTGPHYVALTGLELTM